MSSHDWLEWAGGAGVLVTVAIVVLVILYPWLLLFALRRMAKAQEKAAEAFTNAAGHPDVGESMAHMSREVGRMANAMEAQARALQDLAVAMEGVTGAQKEP